MSAGTIQLVSYGEENMFLNDDPQISYFKIIFKRYTNFSIETIQANFLYKPNFGQKYSCEISKYGDLIHKMWIVIELPNIPIILNIDGYPDKKLKFAWARKIAYVLIDYIEISIGGSVISRQYGEFLANLETLNPTLFSDSMNQYNGNLPELYEFQSTTEIKKSYTLHIPLQFWFCLLASQSLPVLCLEYSTIMVNVNFKTFKECSLISPTNYIQVETCYGVPIFNEPLIQINSNGIASATFDSLDINEYNEKTYNVKNYNLYYRKISNASFETTDFEFFDRFNIGDILNNFINSDIKTNYFIYGLWSKSIIVPVSNKNLLSNDIENTYFYRPFESKITLLNTYLLIDYIFLDRNERNMFYNNKHEYIIEQTYFTGNKITNNIVSANKVNMINPCKWVMFMAQLSYMTNNNVNDYFNYTTSFIRNPITNFCEGKSLIKNANILLNNITITGENDMEFYNRLIPFLKFPKSKNTDAGFGIYSFSLYPITTQQSGSINMSYFSNVSINNSLNITDVLNNDYILKAYFITINVFRVIHGVGDVVFSSAY